MGIEMINKTEAKRILEALEKEKICRSSKEDPRFGKKLNAMRKFARLYITPEMIYPQLTINAAITLLKMGVCQELSQRFILEYCIQTKQQNMSLIVLANKENFQENHELAYMGPLKIPEEMIIGKDPSLILPVEHAQSIEQFMKSHAQGLFVDPLLNCLGLWEEDGLKPLVEYCQQNKITHVMGVRPFAHLQGFTQMAPTIKQNAQRLAKILQPFQEGAERAIQSGLLDAKKAPSATKEASSFSVSSQAMAATRQPKPSEVYDQATAAFKAKDHFAAKKHFEQALEIYQAKKPDSPPCAKCYSGLASCHREMKEYPKAIENCEKALLILYPNPNKEEQDTLQKVVGKYNDCLKLSRIKPEAIYQQAVDIYKNQATRLPLALYQLLYTLTQLTDPLKQALCHSTLASCYEKLGQIDQAKTHLEKALDIRERALGKEDELTQRIQTKLEKLQISSSASPAAPGR